MAIDVGNLVKSFMSAKTTTGLEGRKALSDFMKSNNAKGLSTTNVMERMNDITFSPIRLGESQRGAQDFLAVPSGGANGEYYFLPNFKAYTDNHHVERGAYEIFDSNFSPGQVYDFKDIKNVMPAKGSINSDSTLSITERGSIDFGNGESIRRFERDPVKGITATEIPTASPEQQLAEDFAAKNAKLLEETGHPIAEPPKVTPQPSQPVPDKTVTAPEPKPVDPVPETGKPVTDSKRQAEESEQLSQKLSNIGDNSIEIAEAKKAKAISDNFQREQRDALAEDYISLSGADDVVPNTAPKGVDTSASANVSQQELSQSQKYANNYYDKRNQIQESLKTGSGKSIQESANSAAAADVTGDSVDMTIDRAMLRQKIGGDRTTWGRKDAEEYQLNNVIKKLEDQQLAIAQNKKFTPEQRIAAWNKNKKEAEDILDEGPGVGDYFFGNKLHHSAIGAVALFGAGSAAFGGHKSNAELYSSPF